MPIGDSVFAFILWIAAAFVRFFHLGLQRWVESILMEELCTNTTVFEGLVIFVPVGDSVFAFVLWMAVSLMGFFHRGLH